ncbi:Acetyl esterase/lipase [Methylobacterium sp. 275MFSha3.1]|uniref:alpha/beta hydrolase n=1 Tax=Methylobacterium sp. 275MFSha3.1 TaxID=1502746 RepID=UPI0008A772E4|nr:alpha/beta hydrolase [Methylobacterium sp. 275MFSha3.1]SEI15819.1 Acetyl esterase/lipase [Methylobacterium sp. 275MFSha3.1]
MMIYAALVMATVLAIRPASADPVELATFRDLPRPEPTLQIAYGEDPAQGVDVFLPDGPGPHPVAVLLHGGCWSANTAGREQMRHLGPELTRRGIAVWSIGYRRANEAGGGYPGTYQDVGAALDRLAEEASSYRLDLSRVVLAGHSAGGHLALWAASRGSVPAASPLHGPLRVVPRAVISLGGVGDLGTFARFVPVLCGPGIVERLAPTDKLVEISPAALTPSAGLIVMVSGVLDRLVPPWVAHDYARTLKSKPVVAPKLINVPDAGHFDLVTPSAPAWQQVRALVEEALELR